MRELFVYYRVHSAQAPMARGAVLAFQAELTSRHPALRARLLRRTGGTDGTDGTDGEQTWMETYATDPLIDGNGITQSMQADIEASARALAPFVQGARHTEVFIASAS